jgi:NPL4 family
MYITFPGFLFEIIRIDGIFSIPTSQRTMVERKISKMHGNRTNLQQDNMLVLSAITHVVLLCILNPLASIASATQPATTPLDRHRSSLPTFKSSEMVDSFCSKTAFTYESLNIPGFTLHLKRCPWWGNRVPRGGGGEVLPNDTSSSVLRIRQMDGTIRKVTISSDQWGTITLDDVIKESVLGETFYNISLPDGSSLRFNKDDPDPRLRQTLDESGLSHGSLITIIGESKVASRTPKTNRSKQGRFDPFPDLAKDYDAAMLKAKIRRNSGSAVGMSYAAIAALQSCLHNVEPQPTGPIHRIYMCEVAASRFHSSGIKTDTNTYEGRVGLLFGIVSSERKDILHPRKARTSLSSTVESDQYCSAVRVHALWEPTGSSSADGRTCLLRSIRADAKVLRVAKYLGLKPIGWIFSYTNERSSNDGLPVWDHDIETGARLQIELMKQAAAVVKSANDDIVTRFGTLVMDARSGATEAFQLSDVAVQMVAEGMFLLPSEEDSCKNDNMSIGSRHISTRYPVIVDGQETNEVDSVLCLVNTALLSHTGWYTGRSAATSSIKKRDGKITSKARKAILKEIDSAENDRKLLELLCDFSILLALDDALSALESEKLCLTVSKWARGQKKTVSLDDALKQELKRVLYPAI